ncbi:MAG: polyprenyl synthetase family protein [Ruthenibacterium sp.]
MEYSVQYQTYLTQAEKAIKQAITDCFYPDAKVSEAVIYSLLAGGKRVRAVLCFAVCEMLSGNETLAARYAAGVEMLHCYSLIHDDLPCMDNDDYRRGKLSCHKAFGEATALLAGDALLTASFETLVAASDCDTALQNAQAVAMLSRAAGTSGMILGQELDLHYETVRANETQLREIHRNKTGKLIDAAAQLGAIAAKASDAQRLVIEQYAFAIGLVFQIVDDVLDVTATQQTLGKPVGSDEKSSKTTFVTLMGVDESMRLAAKLTAEAGAKLADTFGEKSQFLTELAASLLERKN